MNVAGKALTLSRYPIASLRELTLLASPIILVLICTNLASFCDRLFLSRYSLEAFEGCVSACCLTMLFQIPCVRLASISQVFVGQKRGEGTSYEIGQYIWQMIWFSLLSLVLTLPLGFLISPLYFSGTLVQELGMTYFKGIMYANFLFPLGATLSSFFIGIGRTRFVVYAIIISLFFHLFLDWALIFGIKELIEPLGIVGAIIATIASQILFCLLLFFNFFKKAYREEYGTAHFQFKRNIFRQSLQIGFPSALGKLSVLLSWVAISKVMITKGEPYLTVLTVGSTLGFFFLLINEGLGKAITTIASYIIGANQWPALFWKLGRSTLLFLALFSLLLSIPFVLYPNLLLSCFFPSLQSSEYLSLLYVSFFWIWLYAFTNGLSLLGVGLITATQQTLFYMIICNLSWVTYAIVLLGINNFQWPADRLWLIMAIDTFTAAMINIYWVKTRRLEDLKKVTSPSVANSS